MKHTFTLVFVLIASTLIGKPLLSKEGPDITLILAAEMPDIAGPAAGKYGELQALIKNTKASKPQSFFLFGGGSIGPSALSNLDRGSHIIDILNSLEPDAMGVAKREFSYFEDELSLRSYEAAFPIVSSNIIDTRINAIPHGLAPYALIAKGETKLGFISIIDNRVIEEYLLKNIEVIDPVKSVAESASALKEAGADVIVLHYFYAHSFIPELLRDKVIDFAFISNTRLSATQQADIKKHPNIFLLEAPGNAVVAEISTAKIPQVKSVKQIILSTTDPDTNVQSQIDAYQLRLNRLFDDQIGIWQGDFSTKTQDLRNSQNAFGNYIVDTMRSVSGAEIALINSGSIRGNRKYVKNSTITRKTIANELPFRSTLSVISITGTDLLAALEVGFAGLDEGKGSFPQVSGLRIVFDSALPQGQRIKSIEVNGSPLDSARNYVLATTDYLVDGGDGYTPLSSGKQMQTSAISENILISDLVQREIRLQGKLSSKIDLRLVDFSSEIDK